jgi:hypothetical protein
VTVTASDGTHSASQTFNWTVARLSVPNPGNLSNLEGTTVSLQITATDSGGTPSYSATNLPTGLSINSSTGLISGTIGTAAHGSSPYTVTVTATDGTNSASQTFMWTVTPRVALVNPGAISNAAGDAVSLQIQASTVGGTLTYTASGLPSGLTINSSSGLISGTISSSAASATPYAVTVTANDGTSTSSQTFYWTVSTVWEPVTSDQSNYDGDVVSLSAAAHYHSTGTLSYTATGLPSGLSISSSTGLISGTVASTADTSSPYTVTLTATDGTNSNSSTFTWRVSPRVSVTAPNNQTNAVGDVVSLPVTATDALNSTLTYSATGLPTGLSINSSTGVISGTISVGADASSPYTTTVTAADSVVSASATFTWTVTHVSLANPGSQYSADGQAVSLALSGHDSDGDTVTYSATGLPSGLSISSSTGVISGTLGTTDHTSSPNFVTVTASDSSHSTSQQFLWYVSQIGVTNPGSQTNQEGSSVSLQISATGSSLTYIAGNLPPGLSINSSTGLISGTLAVGSAATGPYTTTVTASNGTLSSSQTFTWTITPKVSVTAPSAQTNLEGDIVSLQVQASEQGATLTYSAFDLPSGLSINSSTGLISGTVAAGASANSVYDVTVTVSDGTYSTSQIFGWTVTHGNDHAPVLTNPGTQANVIGDSVVLPLTATDSDNDTLSFTETGLPNGLSINPVSGAISGTLAIDSSASTPYAVTVTVTDGNGGTASQTFNWVVTDPPFMLQAANFNATEGTLASGVTVASFTNTNPTTPGSSYLETITWGDGSNSSGTITPSGTTLAVTASHTYDHAATFSVGVTVTDGNGAQSSTVSTATVAAASITATGGLSDTALANSSVTLSLATFTDANPHDAASTYTATISWGDGTANSTGTITGNNGSFSVTATHTYTSTGAYTATITITDADNTSTSTTSTVNVGQVLTGLKSNVVIATFTTSDPHAQASNFTATINWGDGTGTDATPTVSGTRPNFQVNGNHVYTASGSYTVSVTITDQLGSQLTGSKTVIVKDVGLSATAQTIVGNPNVALNSVVLAAFTDQNSADTASKFTAKVNWGDGTALDSTPTVSGSTGLFKITGTHTYTTAGDFNPLITIYPGAGGTSPVLPILINMGINILPRLFPVFLDNMTFLGKDDGIPGGYILSHDYDYNMPDGTPRTALPKKYDGPQWELNPAIQYPYAYVRGSFLAVNAVFSLNNQQFQGNQVLIKGTVWDWGRGVPARDDSGRQIKFDPKIATQGDDLKFHLNHDIAFVPFPDKVYYYQPLVILWAASLDNGNTWSFAGASSNLVYLTYDSPILQAREPWLLQTFVDYGSRRATDLGGISPWLGGIPYAQTRALPLLAAIWTNFKYRSAKRAYDQLPLYYYGNWNTTVTGSKGGPLLVWLRQGMCGAWEQLLQYSLWAQGLTCPEAASQRIAPTNRLEFNSGGILVKSWTFSHISNSPPPAGVPAGRYPYTNYVGAQLNGNSIYGAFDNPPTVPGIGDPYSLGWTAFFPRWVSVFGVWVYVWDTSIRGPDVKYNFAQGPPGENNGNPRATFPNHGLVWIANKWYDPSYGVTWDSLLQFQNTALAGFWTTVQLNGVRAMLIRSVNPNLLQLEATLTPAN